MISTGAREALNQQLLSLRDKTLWAFDPAQVKSIKIRTGKTVVDLEKPDAGAWRWTGKPDVKVRSDRVENFLRQLKQARIVDFVQPEPKDLRALGLAPQARTEVTLVTPKGAETLFLGAEAGPQVYARQGSQGPVVKVGKELPDQIARAATTLEDRRLWTGPAADVAKVVWGPPGRTWTAVREQNHWQITGPDKTEAQQSVTRFQMGIVNFQNLEYSSLLTPAGAAGKAAYLVEFVGLGDKPIFSLEEVGKKGPGDLIVRTKSGETAGAAVISDKDFARWQQEMERLSKPPAAPAK
jgi:hypothetical protein